MHCFHSALHKSLARYLISITKMKAPGPSGMQGNGDPGPLALQGSPTPLRNCDFLSKIF